MKKPTAPADDATTLIHKLTEENNRHYADLCTLSRLAYLLAVLQEQKPKPKLSLRLASQILAFLANRNLIPTEPPCPPAEPATARPSSSARAR